MPTFMRSFDILTRILEVIIAFLLCAMVVIMFLSVFYRYLLNNPIGWADQICQWIFVWLVYLGIAVGYRRRIHIGVDVLVKRLKPTYRKAIALLTDVAIGGFLVIVCYYGVIITIRSAEQIYGSLELPPSYMYAAGPVSAFFMLLFVLDSIRRRLINTYDEANEMEG